MISVVSVFNNARLLEQRLMNSLKAQTVRYEVVPVDNCNGRFQSAARALNWGASQATGNWILFAHQDVALLSRDWLEKAEETLEQLDSVGWVGVAGRTAAGEQRGFLRNCAALQGLPFSQPNEVQTLDELLLIHRRNSETRDCFDDEVPGWHAYGVDACCDAIRRGKKNYVLPLPVWHDSSGVNLAGLPEAHEFVWQKHGQALGRIHTTCGDLAEAGELAGDPGLMTRVASRIRNLDLLRHGFRQLTPRWFHETMDSLMATSPLVQCLHDRADQGPIEAEGFGSHPVRRHAIVHTFSGLESESIRARDVVIAQDLTKTLPEDADVLKELKARVDRVWLCLSIGDLRKRPRFWHLVSKGSDGAMLTSDLEGELIAVAQVQ